MANIGAEQELAQCGTLRIWKWSSLTENDTALAVAVNGAEPISIMVEGTFGTGGSVGAQGSNAVSGNFYQLFTLATFSEAGISPIRETALFMRPTVFAGTGVSVDVYLLVGGTVQ